MTKSQLCQRIELCGSIQALNKDGCCEAIRLLCDILGNNSWKQLLSVIISNKNILSHDDLQKFEKEVYQLLSSNSLYVIQQESTTTIDETLQKEEKRKASLIFPLPRLPIDLITKISLFLNEKDIFQFEQCCRLFYTMINNTRYLKQSNNFNKFTIDNKRFEQLTQSKYSFFKYSKAKTLEFYPITKVYKNDDIEEINKFFDNMSNKWDKIKKIGRNDGLFDNLFRSIKSLSFNEDGMTLFSKMPVQIMFGIDSQLERMKLDHYWNDDDMSIEHYQLVMKEFEDNYNGMKDEIEKQGGKMRKLKVVEHVNSDIYDYRSINGLRCVSTDHLSLMKMSIDLEDILNIRALTCNKRVQFGHHLMNGDINHCNAGDESRPNIETLRLLDFEDDLRYSLHILHNTNVIESLNLHNSCKNLLVQLDISVVGIVENSYKIDTIIESILKKEHYYSLENVNLLLKSRHSYIDWMFTLLKRNVKILKHQFKQLNIGINIDHDPCLYQVIEWNSNVDEKFLSERENVFDDDQQEKEKYDSLLQQWS